MKTKYVYGVYCYGDLLDTFSDLLTAEAFKNSLGPIYQREKVIIKKIKK